MTNCVSSDGCSSSSTILLQSGYWYGNGVSSSNPQMFDKVVAPITINGTSCSSQFCGIYYSTNVDHNVTAGTEYVNGLWQISIYDSQEGVDKILSVSSSTLGVTSLPYVWGSFEGYDISSNSMLPSPPVSASDIDIWSSGASPITINMNDWYSLALPTVGSGGITMSVSTTSQSSTTAKITWDYTN